MSTVQVQVSYKDQFYALILFSLVHLVFPSWIWQHFVYWLLGLCPPHWQLILSLLLRTSDQPLSPTPLMWPCPGLFPSTNSLGHLRQAHGFQCCLIPKTPLSKSPGWASPWDSSPFPAVVSLTFILSLSDPELVILSPNLFLLSPSCHCSDREPCSHS